MARHHAASRVSDWSAASALARSRTQRGRPLIRQGYTPGRKEPYLRRRKIPLLFDVRVFKLRTLLEGPTTTVLVALFSTLRPKYKQGLNKLPSLEDVALRLLRNFTQIVGLEGLSQ